MNGLNHFHLREAAADEGRPALPRRLWQGLHLLDDDLGAAGRGGPRPLRQRDQEVGNLIINKLR